MALLYPIGTQNALISFPNWASTNPAAYLLATVFYFALLLIFGPGNPDAWGPWNPGGNVTIPDKIDGFEVTSIGANAFLACTNLSSITIPNSITSLWPRAFQKCTGLTSVTIPDRVTRLFFAPKDLILKIVRENYKIYRLHVPP